MKKTATTTRSESRMRAQGAEWLAACLMITAASFGSARAEPRTITAVMHSGLRVLDPVITTAHITRNHGYMIYDTLLAIDENYKPQPQMASWKVSDDGLTYTFTLRDGLKFHDGAPVTARGLRRLAQALGQARRRRPDADGLHRQPRARPTPRPSR